MHYFQEGTIWCARPDLNFTFRLTEAVIRELASVNSEERAVPAENYFVVFWDHAAVKQFFDFAPDVENSLVYIFDTFSSLRVYLSYSQIQYLLKL